MQNRILYIFPSTPTPSNITEQLQEYIIGKIAIPSISRGLVTAFLRSIARLIPNFPESFIISSYESFFIGKSLEVWACDARAEGFQIGLQRLILSDLSDTTLSIESLISGSYLFFDQEEAVNSVGGVFFQREILNKDIFRTQNPNLMNAIYFPVQLANDGRGLFFEERLIFRLKELGVVPKNARIELIEDGGGWESLQNLTASVTVHYHIHGIKEKVEFLGTALVPPPPVRPQHLSEIIAKRTNLFSSLGIRSSVLLAEGGVVYHLRTARLTDELGRATPEARHSILEQCVIFAAILDSTYVRQSFQKINVKYLGAYDNFIEISDPNSVPGETNFLKELGVIGTNVFWGSLSGSAEIFYNDKAGGDISKCWAALTDILTENERVTFYNLYRAFKTQASNCC